jgi:translation initiation factor IF-2
MNEQDSSTADPASIIDVTTLTPEEVAAKLQEKYAKMTPDEKLTQIANKLTSIGIQEEKMEKVTKLIQISTEALEKYQKTLVILVTLSIVVFVLYILYKVVTVYF